LAIIWEYYILAQFEIKSDLQDQQFGFRKCSSTTHAIYTLRELIRIRKRSKLDTYVLFLDFSKAFDKIHRIKLMVKLNRYFHPKLWLAIANYYSISSIRIMDKNKNIIGEIKTKSGVKQGGPFSPTGFDAYIDELIKIVVQSNLVIDLNGVIVGIIVYADDTTLACKGWYELQQLIPIFMDYCKKYDIKANPNKTLWMKMGETVRYDEQKIPIIRAPNINEKFVINEVALKKTDRFKFLGF